MHVHSRRKDGVLSGKCRGRSKYRRPERRRRDGQMKTHPDDRRRMTDKFSNEHRVRIVRQFDQIRNGVAQACRVVPESRTDRYDDNLIS
jgi:hypothetical protein